MTIALKKIAVIALGLLMTSGSHGVYAQEAGTVKNVSGIVSIVRGKETFAPSAGMKVSTQDVIVTGRDGSVGITLKDNTLLSCGPNSSLTLDEFEFDSTTHKGKLSASVKRGTVGVVSGKLAKASPDSVSFKTPTTTLGVRGTEFIIDVDGTGL